MPTRRPPPGKGSYAGPLIQSRSASGWHPWSSSGARGCAQRYLVDAAGFKHVKQVRHVLVGALFVGADVNEQSRISTVLKLQDFRQVREAHPFAAHHVLALRAYLDGADILRVDFFVIGDVAGGQLEIKALFQQRRGNDEDNQQHERQIEQRSDIDVTQRYQRIALRKSAHQRFSAISVIDPSLPSTLSPCAIPIPGRSCPVLLSIRASCVPTSCSQTSTE